MTDSVVQLRRCRACGKPARPRELAFHDQVLAFADICDTCVGDVDRELTKVQPVFAAMLAADVPRGRANALMTLLLSATDGELIAWRDSVNARAPSGEVVP